jgi:DNA-binding NtrC family response regulator
MGDTELPRGRILVIDDEESMRHALAKALTRAGYECLEAATGRAGADRFAAGRVDAVLTDMRLPDLGGLDLVAIFTETRPEIPVLVMTGYGSVDTALEAMRRGAKDYIQKPFRMDEVLRLLQRALEEQRLQRENRQLRVMVEKKFAPEAFARVQAEIEAMGNSAPEEETGTQSQNGTPLSLRDAQRRFEVQYVENLLARTGGNVAAAARLAGISRPNFHKKLKSLGVDATRFKQAARRGRSRDL